MRKETDESRSLDPDDEFVDSRREEDEADRQLRALVAWLAAKVEKSSLSDLVQIVTNLTLAIVGVVALSTYHGQLDAMNETNRLTGKALKGSDDALKMTLNKLQQQIDISNELYSEAQKQTESANTLAGNSSTEAEADKRTASAARSAADTARDTLHISQRAYVVVGFPVFDWSLDRLRMPVVNDGHLPAQNVKTIIHEMTAFSSAPRTLANAFERHWNRPKISTLYPNESGLGLSTTIPKAKAAELDAGRQVIAVVGSLVYNDGFPDSPERTLTFCYKTHLEEPGKPVIWEPCDATALSKVLEASDGYPSREDEIQFP